MCRHTYLYNENNKRFFGNKLCATAFSRAFHTYKNGEELSCFHGNQTCLTIFINVLHNTLFPVSPVNVQHFVPQLSSTYFDIILYLHSNEPSDIFPYVFHTNMYEFVTSTTIFYRKVSRYKDMYSSHNV